MKCAHLLAIELVLILVASAPAGAAIVLSAAVRCVPSEGEFELIGAAVTDEGDYSVPKGFNLIPKGDDKIDCRLGHTKVELTISTFQPQASGQGRGAGGADILSLRVAGRYVLSDQTRFNWQVSNERVLTRVRIKKSTDGQVKIDFCVSDGWDWRDSLSFAHEKCEASLPYDY